ncbi:MAG: penicillin-binding protein 1C [Sporocytophaga sp.]|uniref:penicillin-binding protein 1C n=1 Tax=Sporocytophaga sp. TaxID=2231183 RepID=UPI001B00169E|nr:penicillin-binding protein 1C [Sporocytophaga sp.]MBO9699530.1 penicillin-binding protein 1C [Sporocytophaga sp.]
MNYFKSISKKSSIVIILLLFISFLYLNCLPEELFTDPVATIITDRKGFLLSARIAEDKQWRFPTITVAPDKFSQALITFEDKRFYSHPGVDIIAIFRAIKSNIEKVSVISGGSTISMQVIRLSRKGKPRTIKEKIIEVILATRLEIRYTKNEIMALYASHAPFGGNVVGVEAAAWKYFGRSSEQLTWAESATLAVLPNAPGLIHPGKNRTLLKTKRDLLLEKLRQNGIIDSLTCVLSKQETLPEKPVRLEDRAPHFAERIRLKNKYLKEELSVFYSSLDKNIQEYTQKILDKHHTVLSENSIENIAALIVENKSSSVIAYVGNSSTDINKDGSFVDMITSPRSTGSILKPLLYAMMLNDGYILPHALLPDIPCNFGGFTPKNFDKNYDGAVPANVALYKSLNIPAVYMLDQYGTEKFIQNLKALGMGTLNKQSSHYGLSLILGGAEASIEDIALIYSNLSNKLCNSHYINKNAINYSKEEMSTPKINNKRYAITSSSIWYTFEAMADVVRPAMESNWQAYENTCKIAWKTGTSFGFRDAWAVGCTPEYTIVIWAGNASGEGRPMLTGIEAAAPVMFDLFNALKTDHKWFDMPENETVKIEVCRKSGYQASEYCTDSYTISAPEAGVRTRTCPYHKQIFMDNTEKYQVKGSCYSPSEMITKSWFVLPPIQEYYYKNKNADYITLPPYKTNCSEISSDEERPEIIYPKKNSKIYIPVNLDGSMEKVVLQANIKGSRKTVYWHLDEEFIGTTNDAHEIAVNPLQGKHKLTLFDNNGGYVSHEFEIIKAKK